MNTQRSTNTRIGETDNPKARQKYNNKIFQGNGGERDPYLALKKYLIHRPEGIDEFHLQLIDNPKEDIWWKKLPLGLANIMQRMVEKAEIQSEGITLPTRLVEKQLFKVFEVISVHWQSRSSLGTPILSPPSPTATTPYKHRRKCLIDW